MASLDDIFKAYDVRGVVPDQLDAATCEAIGAAFARFAVEQPGPSDAIVVARDMRPSGVELADAFSRGIQSQGVDVVDIGLASTDMLFFASGRLDAPGATLTASHNPAQYNGIKLCLSGAKPIGEDSGLSEIKEMARQQLPAVGEPGTRTERDLLDDFATHIRSFVDVGKLRPLRIVADTANGMGGLVAPAVFAGLPFDVEILYGELDGTFPNHPADPIQVENLRDLRDRVLEVGADIGLAFDGDADRVFLVDEQAEPVPGSLTTSIVAASVLEREPGATILHNLISFKKKKMSGDREKIEIIRKKSQADENMNFNFQMNDDLGVPEPPEAPEFDFDFDFDESTGEVIEEKIIEEEKNDSIQLEKESNEETK
jgi:phosphomannomutase